MLQNHHRKNVLYTRALAFIKVGLLSVIISIPQVSSAQYQSIIHYLPDSLVKKAFRENKVHTMIELREPFSNPRFGFKMEFDKDGHQTLYLSPGLDYFNKYGNIPYDKKTGKSIQLEYGTDTSKIHTTFITYYDSASQQVKKTSETPDGKVTIEEINENKYSHDTFQSISFYPENHKPKSATKYYMKDSFTFVIFYIYYSASGYIKDVLGSYSKYDRKKHLIESGKLELNPNWADDIQDKNEYKNGRLNLYEMVDKSLKKSIDGLTPSRFIPLEKYKYNDSNRLLSINDNIYFYYDRNEIRKIVSYNSGNNKFTDQIYYFNNGLLNFLVGPNWDKKMDILYAYQYNYKNNPVPEEIWRDISNMQKEYDNALLKQGKNIQKDNTDKNVLNHPEFIPDGQAHFDGGVVAMEKYFRDYIIYPQEAIQNKVEGTVEVEFEVGQYGGINEKSIKVVSGIGSGCDGAAIQQIKRMNWLPAIRKGQFVKDKIKVKVNFKLPQNPQKKH